MASCAAPGAHRSVLLRTLAAAASAARTVSATRLFARVPGGGGALFCLSGLSLLHKLGLELAESLLLLCLSEPVHECPADLGSVRPPDVTAVLLDLLSKSTEHAAGTLISAGREFVLDLITFDEEANGSVIMPLIIPILPWLVIGIIHFAAKTFYLAGCVLRNVCKLSQ